jgi:hypothetical protein
MCDEKRFESPASRLERQLRAEGQPMEETQGRVGDGTAVTYVLAACGCELQFFENSSAAFPCNEHLFDSETPE